MEDNSMKVKVKLTDLQTKKVYRGTVSETFMVGKSGCVLLTDVKPPSVFEIKCIKGYIISDSKRIVYLMDSQHNRFKIHVA